MFNFAGQNKIKIMDIRYIVFAFVTLLLSGCATDQSSIFNGNDLTGWKSVGGAKWSAENGNLICESGSDGEGGYLTTEKSYDNFDLSFEFKEESLKSDFGVFFHTDVEAQPVYGWKVVIAPKNGGTGGIFEQNGRGWLEHIPEQSEKVLKPDDWNKMRIKVERGHVTTWLNGYLMIDYTDSKIAKGVGGISFGTGEGGGVKVVIRNIKVKELDELDKVNQYI
jgi:hypothetical protein